MDDISGVQNVDRKRVHDGNTYRQGNFIPSYRLNGDNKTNVYKWKHYEYKTLMEFQPGIGPIGRVV